MAPVQSDGIEYEFSLVFDVAMNHEAEVSKDRTHLFDKNKIFQITEAVGEQLVAWRNSGKTKTTPPPTPPPVHAEDQPQDFPPPDEQFFPEDDLDAALGRHPEGSIEAASEYVITFGQFRGRTIGSLPRPVLKGFADWIINGAKAKGVEVDPNGEAGKALTNASIVLGLT
jgi:hypothetical protein